MLAPVCGIRVNGFVALHVSQLCDLRFQTLQKIESQKILHKESCKCCWEISPAWFTNCCLHPIIEARFPLSSINPKQYFFLGGTSVRISTVQTRCFFNRPLFWIEHLPKSIPANPWFLSIVIFSHAPPDASIASTEQIADLADASVPSLLNLATPPGELLANRAKPINWCQFVRRDVNMLRMKDINSWFCIVWRKATERVCFVSFLDACSCKLFFGANVGGDLVWSKWNEVSCVDYS